MQKHLSLAGRAGLVCLLLAILACANLSAVDKPLMNWTARQERLAGDQLEGGLLYPEQYFRKVREKGVQDSRIQGFKCLFSNDF